MDVVEPAVVVSGSKAGSDEPPGQAPDTATALPAAPAATISFQHRVEYAALRFGCALARIAPIRSITATGAAIGWTVGPWLRQNRRALVNLAIAFPEKTDAEHRRIARAMWANMGRTFAETLILDRIVADAARIEFANRAQWEERFAAAVPSIGCTLHMGNWELAILPFKRFGRNPVGVYKPLDNPLIDAWLRKTRGRLYTGGLLGKGRSDDSRAGPQTARQLISIARRGGSVGFGTDHVDRRGEVIPFMGRQSRFTTAPAMIARHVGARFWVGRCVRIGKGSRFRMELRELTVPATKDKSADALALTVAKFAQFEAWIRESPEQWMWWNTRWVRPDGTMTGRDAK